MAGQPRVLLNEDENENDDAVTVEYVIYARNVRDGSILWSELVGTASISGESKESLVNGSSSSSSSSSVSDGTFPSFGSSGDFWSALLPFDLATAPNRRLLVKYDSLSLTGNPGSSMNMDLSISVFSLHCSNEIRSLASALFTSLFVGTLASILLFRCFFGSMWAFVSTKTFDIKALRANALRKAAEKALSSITLPPLSPSSSTHFLNNNGERPLSPLVQEDMNGLPLPLQSNSTMSTSSTSTSTGGIMFRQREASNDSTGSIGSLGQDPRLGASDDADDGIRSPGSSTRNKRKAQKRSSRSSRSASTVSLTEDLGGNESLLQQQQQQLSKRRRSLSGGSGKSSRSSVESGGSSGSGSVVTGGGRERGRRERERKRNSNKSGSPSSSTGSTSHIHSSSSSSSSSSKMNGEDSAVGVAEANITLKASLDSSYRDSLDGLLVVDFLKSQTINQSSSSSPLSSIFPSSFSFIRTGTPWVLISVLHTFSILVALSLSVAQSSSTISTLQLSLLDPLVFYNTYLINRSPDTDTVCPSQAAAACFCSSVSPTGSESSLSSLCNSTSITCDFDLSPCRSMCSSVLESTGSCAASVLMFTCSCANDCINTQLAFNSTTVAPHPLTASGGLVEGLATCRAHYTTLNAVLVGALIAYAILAGATFFTHFRLGSILNLLCSAAEKRAYMNASDSKNAAKSIDETKKRSADKKARRGGGGGGGGTKGPRNDVSSSEKIGESLIYISLWKAVVLGGGLLWASFLVLQGRYCTGIDGQVTGGGTPIVGNSLPPKDSLILRNAPGCAFGAAWQNVDLEGKVLSTVYLSILSFLAALVLSLSDQILLLLFACFHRCNSIGVKRARLSGQKREEEGGGGGSFLGIKATKTKDREGGGGGGVNAPKILCSCTTRGEVTCAKASSTIGKSFSSGKSSSSSSSSSSLLSAASTSISGPSRIEKPFNTEVLFVPERWVDLNRYPPRRIDCCVRRISLLKEEDGNNAHSMEDSEGNRAPLRRRGDDGDFEERDFDASEDEIITGIIITIPGLIQVTIGLPLVVV